MQSFTTALVALVVALTPNAVAIAQGTRDAPMGAGSVAPADGLGAMTAVGKYLRSKVPGVVVVDPFVDCRLPGACREWVRTRSSESDPAPHPLAATVAEGLGGTTHALSRVVSCPAGHRSCRPQANVTYVRVSEPVGVPGGISVHVVIISPGVGEGTPGKTRIEYLQLARPDGRIWQVTRSSVPFSS
jgi:hypothetical protein